MELGYNCLDANGEFLRGIEVNLSKEELVEKLRKEGCTGIDVWVMKSKKRKERKRSLRQYRVAVEVKSTGERFVDDYWAYSMAEAREEIEDKGFVVKVIATKKNFTEKLMEYNMSH